MHSLNGNGVFVKREDLFLADCQPECPPLAKLRGSYSLLKRIKSQHGIKKVAVFDTRISKAGQGIAFISRELGMECMVGFPQLKGGEPSESQKMAGTLGARLYPMKAGRTAAVYGTFAREAYNMGYTVMPLGLVCRDTIVEVAQEAARTLKELDKEGVQIGTIVVSTGTGTICAGVHLGADAKVVGVSCGMDIGRQAKRMRFVALPDSLDWNWLELIKPGWDYYDELDTSSCPFRTNPWYDMKAWAWLKENMDKLSGNIMFWNIGA